MSFWTWPKKRTQFQSHKENDLIDNSLWISFLILTIYSTFVCAILQLLRWCNGAMVHSAAVWRGGGAARAQPTSASGREERSQSRTCHGVTDMSLRSQHQWPCRVTSPGSRMNTSVFNQLFARSWLFLKYTGCPKQNAVCGKIALKRAVILFTK